MKVAMAPPHEPLPGAPLEQYPDLCQMSQAAGSEVIDGGGVIAAPRDANDAPIELRGIACIDMQLLFAGTLALLESRIVEKRQPHRALDLQHAIAAEKDRRGVGVDPLGAPRRAEAGTFQKIEYAILEAVLGGLGDHGGWFRVHGCNTAAPVICPARNLAKTSLACRNGNATVWVLTPAWAATLKHSIPSWRVRL